MKEKYSEYFERGDSMYQGLLV